MTSIGDHVARRRARTARELATAVAYHRAGRLDRAAVLYQKILEKTPGNPDALHLLGVIAMTNGRPERAIQLIEKAIAAMPASADVYSNLGNAQRAAGRLCEARKSYRKAIALNPDCAPAHNNLAFLLCEKGEFVVAEEHGRRAVKLAPFLAEAHNNLGNALRGLGQLAAAEGPFFRATELEPGVAVRHVNLGNLLLDLKRPDDARQCYQRAVKLDPGSAVSHYGLGLCHRFTGDMETAVASFRKSLLLAPGRPVAWNDLGRTLYALGRFEEAAEAFHRALAIDPDFSDPYRNLALCQQLTAQSPALARLAELSAKPDLPAEDRATAGYALGKALDDADRFDEAFRAYDAANRLYREARAATGDRFDAAALQRQVDETIAAFGSEYFHATAGWGDASELPTFIVGMPRSGTSLVEQICASHSQVFGAGELREIGELAAELGQIAGADLCASSGIAPDRALVRRLAAAHVERLSARGAGAARVIDKLPDNIFMLGTIATLFPRARIIFCRREARDTCLSCYFQKFTAGQLTFSYDLADCAHRYRETERLAAHWRRVLPLRILDIEYETLVADREGESRRLIAYLDLEWEAGCLDFHRTQRSVTTASGWQVRQPIYTRSVGRWRHYRCHLSALDAALAEGAPARL